MLARGNEGAGDEIGFKGELLFSPGVLEPGYYITLNYYHQGSLVHRNRTLYPSRRTDRTLTDVGRTTNTVEDLLVSSIVSHGRSSASLLLQLNSLALIE